MWFFEEIENKNIFVWGLQLTIFLPIFVQLCI